MKRVIILVLALAILLAACGAPVADAPVAAPVATNPPESQPESQPEASLATLTPEETQVEVAPASRGDGLVATDPSLLTFDSGRPQLVEFFRFT